MSPTAVAIATLCATITLTQHCPADSPARRPLAPAPASKEVTVPSWVLAKPSAATQVQKSIQERGGQNPCLSKDPGFGNYHGWSRAPTIGQLILPLRFPRGDDFDVMFHFHGHDAARKSWVQAIDGVVFVGIDLGIGSGAYEDTFAIPGTFQSLKESVVRAVAAQTRNPSIRIRNIGLSSWSAGYGAVDRILRNDQDKSPVDSVILLDGLHAGYGDGSLNSAQMEPFLEFARAAAQGRKFMFLSHSSIIPPGYASTTETANYLIFQLGGKPTVTRPRGSDPFGLDLLALYIQNGFHVRGYSGNDKMDHCAHLGLYRDVVRIHLKQRWR